MKKGKKYVEASKLVDKSKSYELKEAIKLVKQTSITKFDASIEIAMNLNIDTKKAGEQLRGSIVLPNGTGKTSKILVIAKGEAAEAAKKAGATYVGELELIEKIEKENWFDFDIIIATPEMMPALGKIGKVLGPKGLMPNPKTGTVTITPAKVVEDVKKGMIEYRADSFGNIHSILGKVSFAENALEENLTYFINTIIKSKPVSVKGPLIKNVTISTTMGPGIKVSLDSFDNK
ncbi:MAG: 50S ribosomal protein L1 [Bacilli bacterium]|nr:50S ribosomal protein L1 [Bacilli bacterium]MDD4795820.1 50S ribosomal protein L1 [Bacilli bacterium]